MNRITADGRELMDQASITIDVYMKEAIEIIDRRLGAGAAAANPGLVGTLVTAMVGDYSSTILAQVVGDLAEAVSGLDFARE